MGAFLEKPKTEKSSDAGSGNGIRYGLSSMQGWRVEMEDAHVARVELSGPFKTWSYFGVFDGHAGARVSELCASKLLETILSTEEFKKLAQTDEQDLDVTLLKRGVVNGFLTFDRELAFEDRDEKSGSTAVIAFITPTHIIMANCGDSRAMLVREDKPFLATEDHKPYLPIERKRISDAGGQVMLSRVNGSLAVSRSLGDFEYKQVYSRGATEQLVSPEPDVFVVERKPDRDQVLILACDGIWDVFENDALATYVLQRLRCVPNLDEVCQEILDTSLHKGSKDNMSVLLIALDGAPTVDPEAARKDGELDKAIRSIVMELLDSPNEDSENLNVNYVASVVQSMELPNYPPGGFITKRGFVEGLYDVRVRQNDWTSQGKESRVQ
ncbi:Protein phosphatase 1A [Clonorchis sinensis]|uniref:Protein phosphatase 1A n=1 Tax=Clonorchis sinensis TaxID=79923 RepID=A0A3R7JKL0_CLOSI|nr:Protein phosphatase 1A [Clonorchis sinensis]